MKPKIYYFKIFLSIFISILAIKAFSNKIFIANTPRINPKFQYMVKNLPQNLIGLSSSISAYIAKIFTGNKNSQSIATNITVSTTNKAFSMKENVSKLEKSLVDKSFIPIAKGAYAKSNEQGTIAKIVIDEIDWIEYVFNVKGREIKIKVPKGETPPPQESVEKLY